MTRKSFQQTKLASVIILGIAAQQTAWAAEENTDDQEINSITVTATKRPQMAQDVPIALTAVSEDMIENAGITAVADLRDMVAGLEIVSNGQGNNRLSTRGVTSSSGGESVSSNTSVGYYLDETPMSAFSTMMPELGLWDAERVEMLRGPQGTLFGEGSMAGTVRVITNKPDSGEFEAKISAGAAYTETGGTGYTYRAKVNVPLIEDELALRVVAGTVDSAGWIDVPDLGLTNTNEHEQLDMRLSLRWTPSDELTVDFSYTYQDLEVSGDSKETSRGRYVPVEGLNFPPLAPVIGPVLALGSSDTDYGLTSLTIEYDMGWASLVSATAAFDLNTVKHEDNSEIGELFFGVPALIDNPYTTDIEMFTQEVRLVSDNDGNFNWTIGGFYKSADRNLISGYDFTIPDWGLENDQAFSGQAYDADSYAIFGELSWMLAESVELKIGGRYFSEDRNLMTTELNDTVIWEYEAGRVVADGGGDDSQFSPMAHLSWNVSDDVMLFARYSEGFKSGGVNTAYAESEVTFPGVVPKVFKSETLTTSEVGMKSNFSGNLQLNAYLYSNDWQNLQLPFQTPNGLLNYTQNAGGASATGAELELLSRPVNGLTLSLNAASVDAKIDEDVIDPTGYTVASKDSKIPFIPKVTYSASANYNFPLTNTLSGLAFISYSHRDESFSDSSNNPEYLNSDFNTLKLRLGVEGDNWGAYLYGSNLLDEDSTTTINHVFDLLVYKNYVRPKTFGIEVTASFY